MSNSRIEEILEEWFSLEVIRNKELQLRYKIHNPYLEKQCRYLHHKYHSQTDYNTFTASYIYYTYMSLTKLDDLSDITKASKYCHKTNYFTAIDDIESKSVKIGARRVPLHFKTLSLDYLLNEENTQITLLDMLTEKDNLFHNPTNQIFFNKYFLEWFEETKHTFLTQSQLEFLDNLNSLPVEATYEQIKEVTKTDPRNINDKIYRIANRIILEYQSTDKEAPSQYKKELIHLVRLFETIKNLANRDDNIDTQNQLIFDYITENFEELQPYLCLSLEEHQMLNRSQYKPLLLYKVCQQCTYLYFKYKIKLDELKEKEITINNKPSLARPRSEINPNASSYVITHRDGYYTEKKYIDPKK